jgi:hypothetical protein
MVNREIQAYNRSLSAADKQIGNRLAGIIDSELADAESKIWHAHPVWFLSGNPIVGYSKLKDGIRLMFWSGASFGEADLKPGTGKFKDASVRYTDAGQIVEGDVRRWLKLARTIQWDYKNIYKTKGRLVRIS